MRYGLRMYLSYIGRNDDRARSLRVTSYLICPTLNTQFIGFLDSKSFQACDPRIANSLLFSRISTAGLTSPWISSAYHTSFCMELARLGSNYCLDLKSQSKPRSRYQPTSYGLHRHRSFYEAIMMKSWDVFRDALNLNETDKTTLNTPCMQNPYILHDTAKLKHLGSVEMACLVMGV
jgi:hypothetical protein